MNEQLQVIGLVGQLGLGGVMLVIAFVIWRQAQIWQASQQDRDDKRLADFAAQHKELVTLVMNAQSEQLGIIRETAKYLHDASANLRVVTDRLTERRSA